MSPTGGDLLNPGDDENKQIIKKQVGRRTAQNRVGRDATAPRRKQTGRRTDPTKRPRSPPSPPPPLSPTRGSMKSSQVQLMNVTSQCRVGIAVRMLMMRLDFDDGLSLPLKGLKDQDFDRQEFVHPRGYDIEDLYEEEEILENVLEEPVSQGDVLDEPQLTEVDMDEMTCGDLTTGPVTPDPLEINPSSETQSINLNQQVPKHLEFSNRTKTVSSPVKQSLPSQVNIKSEILHHETSSVIQDDLTEEELKDAMEKTNKKFRDITGTNTFSILNGEVAFENWIISKIQGDNGEALENDVENSKVLYEAVEDMIENQNSVVKVTLAQNGSGVKLKLRNEIEFTGHPQKDSTNWFIVPFLNRYLYFNLFSPKKLFTALHEDGEAEPALINTTSSKVSKLKPHSNPKKLKSVQFIRLKSGDGFIKGLLTSLENGTKYGASDASVEELKTALATAEYVCCAVESCHEALHRDDLFSHVKSCHQDTSQLSQFRFYNENLEVVGLDYFENCGACVVCGFLFLSNGLIPWERIDSHYDKEHHNYTSKPNEHRIKSFDVSAAIKGIKRGRGRPPIKSSSALTPPAGAIHVGDNIFMVRTGSGPSGQPSYTPMNLTPQKKMSAAEKRSLEDPESPSKKRKYTKFDSVKEEKNEGSPRISSRLKKKTRKAMQHFHDELDEDWEEDPLDDGPEIIEASEASEVPADNEEKVGDKRNQMVVTGDMNKTFIKDLVYFFNLYLGNETCKKVMRSMENRRSDILSKNYKTRKVPLRTDPTPQKNENGEIVNQQYCCKTTIQDLEAILDREVGPVFLQQNIVAQQYTYVDTTRCAEKTRVYQFEAYPELTVAAKCYVFVTSGTSHDIVNITVRNNNLDDVEVEKTDQVPGLVPTVNESLFSREMKIISGALSTISCRESKPRFDERGLIMTQKYCCNKTLLEVMSDWWQGFIEMTQMQEVNVNTHKLVMKRRIPINGKEALPQKKLYKVNFNTGSQSLEVDFTYFQTAEGSLNLTFVCVQWIRKNVKVDSAQIDLPSMIDFDSLTVYRRRSGRDYSTSAQKLYYKSSEISFQECVKVLVNSNGVPRNQAIFTLQARGRVVAELRSYLGMFHPTRNKHAELFIGGYKYLGTGCAYRRGFQEIEHDIVVIVTNYKFDKSYTDSSCPEDMPQSFSHAEIHWVNKPVKGIGSSQINARMVDDSYVPYYPKSSSIRRNYRYKTDPEMFALNEKIGTRAITNRLKVLNKNKSSATRPGMQTINNLYNRKPKDQAVIQDEVSAAIQGIPGATPGTPGKRGRKRGVKNKKSMEDDEEAELKCFKDQLLSFDSLIRFPKSVTYNKKNENGMVMVKSCKKLLYALIGSTTPVHGSWSPSIHLEVETYEPSLTNAHMVLTCFSVPSVIHRQRKTPKVCLGPVCLSATKSDEDATILGEHLRYNNENVTGMRSMAAMNDELYHSLRNGLKAYSSVFLYDESSVLNSATNRAKCQKHALKLSEVALSHEIGAITVSWEVYMDKIIAMKHESDMVDLLLSLEEGEEYVLTDEEGKKYFQLTELEKSQLDEDELRFYEIEFFEWLGSAKLPEIPWRDYVMLKVSNSTANPNQAFQVKQVNENDFEAWNSDQSYDNQFFGNIILQRGTLPKQQYHKVGKKKRLAAKAGVRPVPTSTSANKVEQEVEESVNVYSETYTTIEESPAVFAAFDRVVVDGTFMLQ